MQMIKFEPWLGFARSGLWSLRVRPAGSKLYVMKSRNYGYHAMRVEPDDKEDEEDNGCFEKAAWVLGWCCLVILFPFSLVCCLHVAREYQRIVIFRLGRVRDSFGPGLVLVLPCVESSVKVDIRTDVYDVEPQDVITKDSVTISVNAVVYFCIFNPVDAIIKVEDVVEATERICQVTLRNIVGSKALHELLVSRQALSLEIRRAIATITAAWGIRVERVDIMEISLPSSLERSLASEAEAVREARAKTILAEGEAKASKALKEASDVMSQNQITLQLRHLQVLSAMATEKRVNVIFPIPLEIMEPFFDEKELSLSDFQDGDDSDSDDYSGYFTPKLYIEGSPPDNFYDPEDSDPGPETDPDSLRDPSPQPGPSAPGNQQEAATQTKEKVEPAKDARDIESDSKPSGSWGLPAFLKRMKGAEDDGPSTSQQSKEAPRNQPKRAAGSEPYPLLSSTSPRSTSAPPGFPPIPPAPSLPPIPPPPARPPIPNPPPPPPPKPSSSSESPDKSVLKPDRNYYF